ncbi:APOBEC1 complementation factor-like isoform X1 [Biomphalaria glabrata]|uniref:APOBEC1 complementation factor-like isoform X1 n=1 Tax=Biomphalaria glabrata TaxID=6526 RepID=A0A2C9JDL7_BIOGL|nr:APOBEC1 complementation factor-like isoform X1 [Biomphalaria glabrata]KAI8760365.1 APOBEC1 complementation factor-like isoform X1 [Biomphalaria glabrata]KAI8784161.1 APOBEC1 complementation factor isoform X1 [Biomphalaria glabrata]
MESAKPTIQGVTGAPNENALISLIQQTGYNLIQENGQRKFGGPPPDWSGPPPARGCEIFVGKIPRDIYEDMLVPIFMNIGKVYEFRLMMDFSGSNRGFAFCTYAHRADAKRAVKLLNNYEVCKGRFLGVCLSVDNCRLFVGGIPKTKQRDEILSEMSKVTEGVVDVIVYPSAVDKSKNRGFAFVEYENHRAAAMARRKLIPGRVQLWGHTIAVDWAEPEPETDEDIMASVRILYVRNLMLSTTEEHLQDVFENLVQKKDCIERVKKLRDYAFIHFRQREDAINVLECTKDGIDIDGSKVEVVLAKPVDKNDHSNVAKNKLACINVESPMISPVYGALLNPNGRNLSPPALANRGGRGRGAAGSRGAGGSKHFLPSLGRGSYRRNPAEVRLFDLLPGVELTPTNPTTLKPLNVRSPVQLLEELCQKNHWGLPVYQLHSAIQRDTVTNTESQFFLFKVTIPALASQTIQPNKLCRTVEEAKVFAAEFALIHLGIPIESSEVPIVPTSSNTYHRALHGGSMPLSQGPLPAGPSFIVGKVLPNPELFYQTY